MGARFTVRGGEVWIGPVWIWGPWIWQFHWGRPFHWCYCGGCRSDGRAEEAEQADEETHRIAEAGQFDGADGRTFFMSV